MTHFIPNLSNLFHVTNSIIESQAFLESHRLKHTYFTRKRKLTFPDIIKYLLTLPKKSFDNSFKEFKSFFNDDPSFNVTKQAFSLQRHKILYTAFKELFKLSARFSSSTYQDLWHGHEVFAVDGTTIQLPDTKENLDYFGASTGNGKPLAMARVSLLFNVLNDRICDAAFDSYIASERAHALDFVRSLDSSKSNKPPIILFDRGYPSRELIYTLGKENCFFLMRCSNGFLSSVKKAPMGVSFVRDDYRGFPLLLRVIKVKLPNDTIETLVTNLYQPEYTLPFFSELYFLRWGIEEKYKELKSRLQVENFTGIKPNAILQDFYATLYFSNITSMIKKEVDIVIKKDNKVKKLKNNYQANRTYLISSVRDYILVLFNYSRRRRKILKEVIQLSSMHRSEIRTNRTSERSIKHPLGKNSIHYKCAL